MALMRFVARFTLDNGDKESWSHAYSVFMLCANIYQTNNWYIPWGFMVSLKMCFYININHHIWISFFPANISTFKWKYLRTVKILGRVHHLFYKFIFPNQFNFKYLFAASLIYWFMTFIYLGESWSLSTRSRKWWGEGFQVSSLAT